ncbi:hypothetical protein BJX68DRAFT_216197 [Aspergillus pseudodeflectus]|uniref:Wax synthase domain-containing protein n=1 Tax=Aspergillus pseudodeflectus TaxID=176178 RepID=A0ABR4KTG1_9EURO
MTTILLVGTLLFADEKIPLSPSLKRTVYVTAITSSVIASARYPPTSLIILNYANAFLSVAYALRAIELLLVDNPRRLYRLVKVNDSAPAEYVWKPLPPGLTLGRLLSVCDLLINPRGIGWAHGSKRYLPELKRTNMTSQNGFQQKAEKHQEEERFTLKVATQNRLSFLVKEALKLFIAYLVYDAYWVVFGRNYAALCSNFHSFLNGPHLLQFELQYFGHQLRPSPEASAKLVRRFLLPPACWAACYAFIDGIHAAVALIDVGMLYLVAPTRASDPWMYPPVFGSWRYMFWPRLKDIWGKLWHDLCRRTLISSSSALIPRRIPVALGRFLVGFLSFVISGVVHAAGTYAVSKDLHAVLMMMVFFILLPFFVALQEAVSVQILEQFLPDWYITRILIWAADVTYVIWWGYQTAPSFFSYSMIPESLASAPLPESWSIWERF